MTLKSVSDVAREIGCRPRDISDAFYGRILDDSRIVVVAGRRAIPAEYVATIRQVLEDRGKLSHNAVVERGAQ